MACCSRVDRLEMGGEQTDTPASCPRLLHDAPPPHLRAPRLRTDTKNTTTSTTAAELLMTPATPMGWPPRQLPSSPAPLVLTSSLLPAHFRFPACWSGTAQEGALAPQEWGFCAFRKSGHPDWALRKRHWLWPWTRHSSGTQRTPRSLEVSAAHPRSPVTTLLQTCPMAPVILSYWGCWAPRSLDRTWV